MGERWMDSRKVTRKRDRLGLRSEWRLHVAGDK